MKKILMLSVVAFGLSVAPAVADHHEGAHKKSHHKGKMFERFDSDGDGVISKAEYMVHVEKKFSKMDADGNGEVTKDEAHAFYADMKKKWQEKREKRKEGSAASD